MQNTVLCSHPALSFFFVCVPITSLTLLLFGTLPFIYHILFQGQCFIAVDPNAFAPGFKERLQDYVDICRGQEPVSEIQIRLFKILYTWKL